MSFGGHLRTLREEAGLSRAELARRARVPASTLRGWEIENQLHWVLDVAFREDESRVRKDHAPENLGLVRRIALSLLKRAPSKKKVGVACKRKQAGWNDDYLVEVLLGQQE